MFATREVVLMGAYETGRKLGRAYAGIKLCIGGIRRRLFHRPWKPSRQQLERWRINKRNHRNQPRDGGRGL